MSSNWVWAYSGNVRAHLFLLSGDTALGSQAATGLPQEMGSAMQSLQRTLRGSVPRASVAQGHGKLNV